MHQCCKKASRFDNSVKHERGDKSVKKRQPRQKAHMLQAVSKFMTFVAILCFSVCRPKVQNADVRVL